MRPTHDTRSIGDPIRNLEEEDAPLRAVGRGVTLRDLVAEAAAVIRSELTTAELGRTIHAHPTFSKPGWKPRTPCTANASTPRRNGGNKGRNRK